MIILGFTLAAFMGLTLGLIGAGGSILTVPILVYLLGVNPITATGYSLLVVGSAALTGAIRYFRYNLVNLRAAITFSIPAMLTVLATRRYIVPNIPDPVFGVAKDIFIMLLFATLMILVAVFMFRPVKPEQAGHRNLSSLEKVKLVIGSAGVGLLTGMVGAGGGFLIIPTLIALFGLHMKEAIGTSLAVIAINALVGFTGDISAGIVMDFHLLGIFLAATLFGMWIGTSLGKTMDGQKLKKIFAGFTVMIGIAIFITEIVEIL